MTPHLPSSGTEKGNELFPVFLKLNQLNTLVVGGGAVAFEKLNAILNNCPSAPVMLVAPEVIDSIFALQKSFPSIQIVVRDFQTEDLEGKNVLILATDDSELHHQIKTIAAAKGILTNVADTPEICDFYLGSIVKKGDLKIGISTNGKSPTFAKRLKEVLNDALPDEIEEVLDHLNLVRQSLKSDFAGKVRKLNEITSVLVADKK